MRRPTLPLCASVLAAAATAASASGAGDAGRFVLTVRTTQGPTVTRPHPPPGGVGDTFVSSLTLVNLTPQLGRPVRAVLGRMRLTYTIRRQCTSFTVTCVATADFDTTTTLPGGTVRAAGDAVSIARPSIAIPVAGGTGRFVGARGTVTISPASTKLATYRITLP